MKTNNSTKLQVITYIESLSPDGPLNPDEKVKLAHCEAIIRRGWDTFLDVGSALAIIRDERLYRETHSTFERYVREQWQFGKSKAYYLIGAATIVKKLSTIVDKPLPAHESQVRPMLELSDDQAAAVWKEAIKVAGGGRITARIVRDIAAPYLPKRPRKRRQRAMPAAAVAVALATVESAQLALRSEKNIQQSLKNLAKVRGMLAHYATKS